MAVSMRRGDLSYVNTREFIDELVLTHWELARNRAFWHIRRERQQNWNDILSDANYGLFLAARAYRPDRGVLFAYYLRQHIDYEIVNGYRSRLGRQGERVHLSADLLTPAEMAEAFRYQAGGDGYSEVDEELLVTKIRELFADMTDAERDVMWKLYVQGKSQREVADMRGVSESAVSIVKRRAVAKLRKRLAVQRPIPGRRRRLPATTL